MRRPFRVRGIEGKYDRVVVRKVRTALACGHRVAVFTGGSDPSGPLFDVYILSPDKILGSVRGPLARSLRLLIMEAR